MVKGVLVVVVGSGGGLGGGGDGRSEDGDGGKGMLEKVKAKIWLVKGVVGCDWGGDGGIV